MFKFFLPTFAAEAMKEYTSSSSIVSSLNQLLISGNNFEEWPPKYQKLMKGLVYAFYKSKPLTYDMEVYRGLKDLDNFDFYKNDNDRFFGFVSTSLSLNEAGLFTGENCCMMKILIPKGSTVFIVPKELGFEDYDEQEVLLFPFGYLIKNGSEFTYPYIQGPTITKGGFIIRSKEFNLTKSDFEDIQNGYTELYQMRSQTFDYLDSVDELQWWANKFGFSSKAYLSEDEVNLMLNALSKGLIQPNFCDFLSNTSLEESRSGASPTQMYFTQYRIPLPSGESFASVYMKTWLSWNTISSPSQFDILTQNEREEVNKILQRKTAFDALDYEARVYKFLTEKVILTGISNNFIPFIALSKCSPNKLMSHAKTDEMKFKLQLASKLDLTFNILTTGTAKKSEMVTLSWVLSHPRKYDVPAILIQILYAILIMQSLEMNHNDLHTENVLIEVLEEPMMVRFEHYGIEFYTTYIAKILDFDHAYVKELGPNPLLQRHRSLTKHSVNRFRKNVDYYQFMCECLSNETVSDTTYPYLYSLINKGKGNFNLWQPKESDTFVQVNLDREYVDAIEEYISTEKDNVQVADNGKIFFQILKEKVDSLLPEPYLDIAFFLSEADAERFFDADNLYFEFDREQGKLIYHRGFFCHSQVDFKDLLVPLEKVFAHKDKFLHRILSEINT